MALSNSKLGEYFVRLPKCNADGSNYIVYRDRFVFAIEAAGLKDHVDVSKTAPTAPAAPADPTKPTTAETAARTKYIQDLREWESAEAIVKQGIAGTIPDSLFLKVKGELTAAGMWKKVKDEFEKKSKMMVVDLRRKLQEERCPENGDVRTHLQKLQTIREDLISMGADPGDDNFIAILLGSLPISYDPYLAALTATSALLTTTLTPTLTSEGSVTKLIAEPSGINPRRMRKKWPSRQALHRRNPGKERETRRRMSNAIIATKRGT
jgi:hypothetical protein